MDKFFSIIDQKAWWHMFFQQSIIDGLLKAV
jgi:hypothetical protein